MFFAFLLLLILCFIGLLFVDFLFCCFLILFFVYCFLFVYFALYCFKFWGFFSLLFRFCYLLNVETSNCITQKYVLNADEFCGFCVSLDYFLLILFFVYCFFGGSFCSLLSCIYLVIFPFFAFVSFVSFSFSFCSLLNVDRSNLTIAKKIYVR